MRPGSTAGLVACALLLISPAAAGRRLQVAGAGDAPAPIVVAADAGAVERTAAAELADHLGQIVGEEIEVRSENEDTGAVAIHVGATRFVRAQVPDWEALGSEEWFLRTVDNRILLYGGDPRGTLYAVYHFLEGVVGVRWWTPWDVDVPRRPRLRIPDLSANGSPAFSYRDVLGLAGDRRFGARRRLNGHFTFLPVRYGGAERYGPPDQVHTFYRYVPPERYFASHPDLFSEIGGMRFGGQGQLCLTNPGLLPLVLERLESFVEQAPSSVEPDDRPPLLFDFSQNDWGRPCDCTTCRALAESEGSQSAPIVDFVNRLADAARARFPEIRIDTLAYHYSVEPPRTLVTRDNVVVRLAGLFERDFSKPIVHPANAEYRRLVESWREHTAHLRIWEYAAVFGDSGEMPLPNVGFLADDYRFYRALGVEGIFVQHPFPIAGDFRDLKIWLETRLLEAPDLDSAKLVREFTDGFYGRAGRPLRRYLHLLADTARRHPERVGYMAAPEGHRWLLDREFMRKAHRLFDRAAERCSGDEKRARRVRHARLSLDRATIALGARMLPLSEIGIDWQTLVDRYRATWFEQIERRFPEPEHEYAFREVEREIAHWTQIHLSGRRP